jgi:glycosyltransferase involved in cell wall biosynthesis
MLKTSDSEMRVALYVSPWRSIEKPTGVGQHIARMSSEVAGMAGVSASLLATRSDYSQIRGTLPEPLGVMPVHYLPGAERLTRALMIGTSLLPVERWCGEVDWLYCPKEQPVASRRARLAVTVHDVLGLETQIPGIAPTTRTSRLRWRMLMRKVLERASLIATVSEFTRGRLVELFRLENDPRLVVVGNGVGEAYFRPEARQDPEVLNRYGVAGKPYLCLVGSLTHRKGGDLVLDLAKRLLESKLPHRIIVSGRRHDAELVSRMAEMKSDCPTLPIDLPGYVSDEDQAALLSHSSALLFPSRYEGFGIPVLEAMAAGAPVICSRNAALPEVAGDAALYLDGESVDEMLEAVRHVEDYSNGRATMIAAGRRRAAEYTWRACAGRLVAAMRERMNADTGE